MKIFVQNQGMREKLPQAYSEYVEDNFLSITQSLGEKIILQKALILLCHITQTHTTHIDKVM